MSHRKQYELHSEQLWICMVYCLWQTQGPTPMGQRPEKHVNVNKFWGASAPPDSPNKSAWRPPKYWICIEFLIQTDHFGGRQADLLGGSGGVDASPQNLFTFTCFSGPWWLGPLPHMNGIPVHHTYFMFSDGWRMSYPLISKTSNFSKTYIYIYICTYIYIYIFI